MIENIVSKRYAEALSDTISEPSRLKPALGSLQAFCNAFRAEPSLTRFFANPAIPLANKNALVGELCDRLNVADSVRNLLRMLNERKKILYLPNIAAYFKNVVDQRLDRLRVDVVSASPLTGDQIERLRTSLSRIFGKDILIETQEDESLIGGMVLRVGSLVVDATIKNRLALLKRSIEKEEMGK